MTEAGNAQMNEIEAWSLDTVFECLTDGVIIANTSGRVIKMNRAMLDMLGGRTFEEEMAHHEVHGTDWIPHGPDGQPIDPSLRPLARAMAGQTFRDYEVEIYHRLENRRFWISCSGTPVTDSSGNTVGSILTVRDIAESKDAARALAKSNTELRAYNQKLDAIIENVSEGMVIADPDGTITHLNRAIREWFGTTKGLLAETTITAGNWIAQDMDGTPLPDERRPLMRALGGESFVNQEVRWINSEDGSQRILSSSGTLVRDDEGNAVCAAVTYRDVAAQKRSETAMQDQNDELERRVAERTAELVTANRELEGFTYTVSHDLRTPLRGITASSMILLEDYGDKLDDNARSQLMRQATAAKKMALLIDDLLFLSRISRSALNVVEFNLSKVGEEVAHDLSGQDWPHPVEFDIEPGLFIEADPRLFRFVMHNLMQNACKFSRKDEGAKVQFGRTVIEGRPAFFVKDQGIGFDMTYVGKIFLPFERLVTDDEFPGTGSGLANARRIVERHGGEIWAESREGAGSTFYFRI